MKYYVHFINNRCYVDVFNGKLRLRRGTGIYEPDLAMQKKIKKRLMAVLLENKANENNVFEIINRYVNSKICS